MRAVVTSNLVHLLLIVFDCYEKSSFEPFPLFTRFHELLSFNSQQQQQQQPTSTRTTPPHL